MYTTSSPKGSKREFHGLRVHTHSDYENSWTQKINPSRKPDAQRYITYLNFCTVSPMCCLDNRTVLAIRFR
ncbi:hypothetical protein I7I50_04969 [Histoplasma capsulatum G186AR]|uniref:Uncharacterized protein n=1 Tax=Ajellomyces capsulatus TaxID=5037 RepID=A0A8H8D8K6_AJECA|nr:hypothetical protein I7I52_03227 [Histoplasma capsulatum]QSS75731.1 hypothetical protein I7I50_04969 [Histoplasma capsulatum G186AR]